MSEFDMMMAAYCSVVFLTMVLVLMNVRGVIQQLHKDHNKIRFYSYLGTILTAGSLIILITGSVVDHVITSETYLKSETVVVSRANRF